MGMFPLEKPVYYRPGRGSGSRPAAGSVGSEFAYFNTMLLSNGL
jgi:hypothetical protein